MRTMANTREHGSALFLALVAIVVVAGLIATGTIALLNNKPLVDLQLRSHGQAVSIAKAGLVEALSWFRRHPLETSFSPQLDPYASPKIVDTADPSMGIVREFAIIDNDYVDPNTGDHVENIQDNLYGRYEVRKVGLFKVEDVSALRCYSSPPTGGGADWATDGSAWRLYSVGIIFKKKSASYRPTDFYLQKPVAEGDPQQYVLNGSMVQIVARAVVATEIRRFNINPPGSSAICCYRGDKIRIESNVQVMGGSGSALLYPAGTGAPTILSGADVSGTPTTQTTVHEDANYNGLEDPYEVHMVFPKMHKADIRAMSDVYTNDYSQLPWPLPNYSLIYIDGDAVFSEGEWPDGRKKMLQGVGVLFVDGDLTLESSPQTSYRGYIYCTGNYLQDAPCMVSGTVIVCGEYSGGTYTGSVTVTGSGDKAVVDYDPSILDQVEDMMSNYRFSRSMYIVESEEKEYDQTS